MILQIGNLEFPINYVNSVVHYNDDEPTFNLYISVTDNSLQCYEQLAQILYQALFNAEDITIVKDNQEELTFSGFFPIECIQNYGTDANDIQIHLRKRFEENVYQQTQQFLNEIQMAPQEPEPDEPFVYYPTDEEMRGPEA